MNRIYRVYLAALIMSLFGFRCEAQTQLPVTTPTPGFTSGQCILSTGTTVVQDAPCPGRTKVVIAGSTLTLTTDDCGAYIKAYAAGISKVTLPASPPPNCTFTFETGLTGFYINLNSQIAHFPGYAGTAISQFTIPSALNYGYYTLQYNGSYWTEAGHSLPKYIQHLTHLSVHDGTAYSVNYRACDLKSRR